METLIILDDADVAATDPLRDFLEAFVMHLPPQLHLVLVRRPPPLRIARLRAAGEVARFTEQDLAIGIADIDGLGPDEEKVVAAIATVTRGWPLAVRLAAEIHSRGGPLDHEAIVDRLLDREGVLFEYLAEEVLATASDWELELLALAAHIPFVDTPLLTWIGRDDLVRLLPVLGRAGVFLERDPAAADRYRATIVGGEFARRALAPPSSELVRRILTSLCERGDAEQALETCLRLGDGAVAARSSWRSPDPSCSGSALDEAVALAAADGEDTLLAELRGDLHYLRGSWDDAVAAYAEAARLGDPTATRLARKRATLLYLRGRLDEADADVRGGARRRHGPCRGVQGLVVAGRRALDARRRGRVPHVPRAGPGTRDGGR